MGYLSLKLDHVAVLREARRIKSPDPAQAAVLAELAGVDGLALHLRRDRRHMRDRDLFVLKEIADTRLTVEIAPTEENIARILEAKPYMAIFVPEGDRELSSQAGFDLSGDEEFPEDGIIRLKESGVRVAVLINPEVEAVKMASRMGFDAVKIFTGLYTGARDEKEGLAELEKIRRVAAAAGKSDLLVMAGQGLNYQNLQPLVQLGVIDEYIIGQAACARAVMVGMDQAVRELLAIIRQDSTSGAV